MASLIDQYLGASTDNAPKQEQSVGTSLVDHYLAGAPAPVTAPPPDASSPQNLDYWKVNPETANQPPQSAISKAGGYVAGLPVEYVGNVQKNARSGIELASQGLKDIVENKSAAGVGKAVLGALGYVASPVTGIFSTAGEEVTKMTGSKDIGDRAELLLGSGLPVAKAGQMVAKALPKPKALEAIIDTIGGPDKIKVVVDELRSNPRLTIQDVVPATRQMAQKLITTEGQHQNKFEQFVQERIGSTKDSITDIHSAAMGTPVNIVDKVNSLKQAAADVGKKEIQPAVTASGPVDISNVISNIDGKLKPGVNSVITEGQPLPLGDIEKPLAVVRKFLTDDKQVRTDAKSLHQFQSALRAKAEDMLNSTSSSERQQGYALMNVRNDIVEAIDKASPRIKLADGTETGAYKQALSNFRDEKQVENAFQMGMLVTKNRLGRLEDDPKFWDNWVNAASPQELEAAREGAKLALQHNIKAFKAGARKAEDVVESQFNVDKLSSLFGKDEITKMSRQLKDEREIAITNQKLIHGSDTAMRMKADSRVDLPVEKPPSGVLPVMAAAAEGLAYMSGGLPGIGASAVVGQRIASKVKHNFVDLPLAKAKNERITDLLTATGEDREQLIKILESRIPKANLSIGSKARLALPFANP